MKMTEAAVPAICNGGQRSKYKSKASMHYNVHTWDCESDMLSDIACINNSRAGCISIKLSWWLELKDQDGDATCEDAGDDIEVFTDENTKKK
jgi:hypothetical protein